MESDLSVLEFLGLALATYCAVAILVALYSAARQFIVYVNTRNEQAYRNWSIRKLLSRDRSRGHANGCCPDGDAKTNTGATMPFGEIIYKEGAPPVASYEEDSDCVVVPRHRQRSRSPYETRSTARRLRAHS